MKILFSILAIVGVAIICVLSFVLPTNPYEIIPSISMMVGDMPLWLALIISLSFIYLLILFAIYDNLIPKESEEEKNNNERR